MVRSYLIVAVGDYERHGGPLHASGEQPKHIQRRGIRPVRVLHHRYGCTTCTKRREQPLSNQQAQSYQSQAQSLLDQAAALAGP